ncbi:beta-glucoside-specific PTS transporter subunit IIABC [Enterococcus faecalis]|uniref:beta-glucoside-specific PTS transporter subunit IIABC n=1 Tax=Enterococcus faecalis TaxID=1351 RepID=UPI00116EB752|nr:beta-glucoside-specific PTS transporter subunit IIABC [Enterococcus faecalis]GEJ72896.1 PTS system beta-glucoside transporter subunit IIABC [Enterococcus faecalis]GEJ74089.1 PTS system beta-glucoside transporter subunit IIABC [Enterococcus faecalis]GEJ77331.1 PTS system beta-glucoside transporter subunit IIABC [Enterococcus faecalis]GEJ81222.1 PTS system beta-glucoside transporter subunit IIABC [Enterococcus faecalis]GEJ83597.1 PTS system beta-glucoside transporter subunit IIABC [Enterococc
MDYQAIAKEILKDVGGKDNIVDVTHCYTRLRFVLKDTKQANKEALLQTEGVISVVESGGQYQVVLGNKVAHVYNALEPLLAQQLTTKTSTKEKNSLGNRILNTVAAIFTPVVPAIAASGMLKGILAIAVMVANNFYQVDLKPLNTYIILSAASDALFYFMPVILGYSAAKVFKTNEYIAMVIGATLCYPTIVSLMTEESAVTLFGLHVTKANYVSTVIPIILAIFILAYVQRFLEKVIPEVLKIIMVPTLSLLLMIPATLLLFGPIGIYLGDGVNWLYYYIMNLSPILLGGFIGGIWCVLVIFGAHRGLVPIGINDVARTGRQNLLAFAGAANFSQAGAAFGVFVRTKNKDLKAVAASATVTALFGITEPAIYGANLRLKKPMIYAVASGAAGGALMSWGGSYGTAFANQGLLTIPVYAEAGTKAFICYLLGCGIAFFCAFLLTIFLGFNDLPLDESRQEPGLKTEAGTVKEKQRIQAPVQGQLVSLDQINDEVFASQQMGKTLAIYPTEEQIVSPGNGQVTALYPTHHAIGLKLDNGAEILLHIGINTVELKGRGFETFVKVGERVRLGQKLLSFDKQIIQAAGYDPTVLVIVTNTAEMAVIETTKQTEITPQTNLFFMQVKEQN